MKYFDRRDFDHADFPVVASRYVKRVQAALAATPVSPVDGYVDGFCPTYGYLATRVVAFFQTYAAFIAAYPEASPAEKDKILALFESEYNSVLGDFLNYWNLSTSCEVAF